MNEANKHRIIGIVVIIALLAIFIPPVLNRAIPPVGIVKTQFIAPPPPKEPKYVIKKKIKPLPVTTVQKKVVPAHAWVIQLASFSNTANAKTLQENLRKQGFIAYMQTAKNSKGITITRVLVGPEISLTRTKHILTTLEKKNQLKGQVIAYNPLGRA